MLRLAWDQTVAGRGGSRWCRQSRAGSRSLNQTICAWRSHHSLELLLVLLCFSCCGGARPLSRRHTCSAAPSVDTTSLRRPSGTVSISSRVSVQNQASVFNVVLVFVFVPSLSWRMIVFHMKMAQRNEVPLSHLEQAARGSWPSPAASSTRHQTKPNQTKPNQTKREAAAAAAAAATAAAAAAAGERDDASHVGLLIQIECMCTTSIIRTG